MTNTRQDPICLNCGMPAKLHIVGFCMPGLRLTPKQRAAQIKKNKKLATLERTTRTTKTKRTSLRSGARGSK